MIIICFELSKNLFFWRLLAEFLVLIGSDDWVDLNDFNDKARIGLLLRVFEFETLALNSMLFIRAEMH